MSEHQRRTVERHCDVCIIDGSAAGLAAALELGRQRRAVIVIDAGETVDEAEREQVRSHGGEILAGRASQVSHGDGGPFRVELVGGHAILARRVLASAAIKDELSGIDGQQALPAADNEAAGSHRGATLSLELAEEDLQAASWRSANQRDWDGRYAGRPMWSGNPNGTLVQEAEGLTPGRALDVGAGEGGDAIWLAEQGWRVVASDISAQALERIQAEASRRGLPVECLGVDANAPDAFAARAFELVSAQYASIPEPRTTAASRTCCGRWRPAARC